MIRYRVSTQDGPRAPPQGLPRGRASSSYYLARARARAGGREGPRRLSSFLAVEFIFGLELKKNLEISGRTKNFHATTMAFSASGTKRNETKKDTKRTCRPSPQKPKKLIRKKLINKLPRDVILMIAKMHPLLIPPFTNKTLRRAVQDYTVNGTGQPHETASGPSRPKTSPALCRAPQHRLPRSLAR